jgi:uncharacterized membrane protein YccF (DUF307 family)
MCGRQASKLILSNTAWLFCGGFIVWLEYVLVGLLFSATIVLFKNGMAILKLSSLIFAPLGADWGTVVETSVRILVISQFRTFDSCCLKFSNIWFG